MESASSQNQSRLISKSQYSSRRDQQGTATLHPSQTGHSDSGFAVVTPIRRRAFIQLAAAAGFGLASGIGEGRAFGIVKRHHDDALLDDLSERCFQYFADAMDPETGICMDLIHGDPADNVKKGDQSRGSTGVTGFALTAMCIGAERGWISREKAKDLVRR
jgi:hypothetical protein